MPAAGVLYACSRRVVPDGWRAATPSPTPRADLRAKARLAIRRTFASLAGATSRGSPRRDPSAQPFFSPATFPAGAALSSFRQPAAWEALVIGQFVWRPPSIGELLPLSLCAA